MSLLRNIILPFTLLLFIASGALFGQSTVKFNKITVDDGLTQSTINCILQDKQGFIWFGTNGGLNRFDGTNFKIFIHDDLDSNTITNNIINHLFEDESGNIWVSTQNGLNIYNQQQESFSFIRSKKNSANSLNNNQVTCTIQDNDGNYWIGTAGGGLNKYDPKHKTFTYFEKINRNPESISSNFITSIEKDKYGYIWIGTPDNGLNMLDPSKGKFLRYVANNVNTSQSSLSDNQVNTIYEDNDGDLWIGTGNGIDLIKPTADGRNLNNRDQVIHIGNLLYQGKQSASGDILSIYQGASGLIWFGTFDNGLGYLNKYTLSGSNYLVDPNNEYSLRSNFISSVIDDRSGILWTGTNAGINFIDRQKDRFSWHKRIPGVNNSISSNNIQSIYKEKNGILWLGTYDKGLTKYDPLTEVYTNYLENDYIVEGESVLDKNLILQKFDKRKHLKKREKLPFLSNNRVYTLMRDKNKRLWIGTGGGGLNILHINNNTISIFKNNPKDDQSISSDYIRCILQDKQGRVWVGTEDSGLNQYNFGKFNRYLTDENDIFSISDNNIRTMAEGNNGELWIGTFGGGLNLFYPDKNKFLRYQHEEKNRNSLSSNSIYTLLYEDKSNKLWIGTTDGLNELDITSNTFRYYNKKNGLPSNSIYSIETDNIGNLWLASNKGITRFNKKTGICKNYGFEDGLESSEFNPQASQYTQNGEMLYGALNGYCSFFPSLVIDNQLKPEIVFTNFKILNEEVPIGKPGSPLKKSISETDTIVISYKDVSISFEFVALNFTDSKKNKYAYKMENLESKWNYVGNRRYANYTNLHPGNYIFRIKASNNDDIWNEEGKSIVIIVTPPFWETWWFYAVSSLILIISIIGAIQIRTRSLHRSKIMLEDQVKIRTQQIENQNKILEGANQEILSQKDEIEKQNKLLKSKNQEISKAKKALDKSNGELKSINSNLEDIVAERTSSLQYMNDELINANNELDMFIYRASHDLKGPIARLLGMTLLAKMDNKDKALQEYITLIEKGAVDINKVLNKLNNIHFINRQAIEQKPIDFNKLIEECKSTLVNYIDTSDLLINLDQEESFQMTSDYILMKIILENLLENAVFFRKTKKAEVDISLRTTRKFIKIGVEDNGFGILNDQIDKIFEMFYRGSEKSKGNGLGLYLVKKAVLKLNGTIEVESEEGKYSCFTISLPKVIVPKELKSLISHR